MDRVLKELLKVAVIGLLRPLNGLLNPFLGGHVSLRPVHVYLIGTWRGLY